MHRLFAVSIGAVVAVWLCHPESIRGQAEPDTAGFVARVYIAGSQTMPYRLFVPKGYDQTKRYPLIVWLHGAGGVGSVGQPPQYFSSNSSGAVVTDCTGAAVGVSG